MRRVAVGKLSVLAGDNRALPPLVLLHGFLGSGEEWLDIAAALSDRFMPVLVDLPGHGLSIVGEDAGPDAFFSDTVDAVASVVRWFLTETEAAGGRAFLAGYSMGGRIALMLALRFPELFAAGVIVSASPGLASTGERERRRWHDGQVALKIERHFGSFLEGWYAQPLFATLKAHPRFASVVAQRRVNEPHQVARALQLLGPGWQPPQWELLRSNRIPLCFFIGEKDERYVEIGRQMVTFTPDAHLELFAGCGHALHIESEALFVERLREFFNQQSAIRTIP